MRTTEILICYLLLACFVSDIYTTDLLDYSSENPQEEITLFRHITVSLVLSLKTLNRVCLHGELLVFVYSINY